MNIVFADATMFTPVPDNVTYKNKLVVLMIDAFGLGYLGLDRIYLGCYLSGVIKFSVLVFGTLLLFTPNRNASLAGLLLLLVSLIWNMVDTFSLLYNAITEKRGVPYTFCRTRKPVRWVNYQNVSDAKNYALALTVVYLVLHTGMFRNMDMATALNI
jgi:TM2 domain-containing membrane protein YozV